MSRLPLVGSGVEVLVRTHFLMAPGGQQWSEGPVKNPRWAAFSSEQPDTGLTTIISTGKILDGDPTVAVPTVTTPTPEPDGTTVIPPPVITGGDTVSILGVYLNGVLLLPDVEWTLSAGTGDIVVAAGLVETGDALLVDRRVWTTFDGGDGW